jgi:hypothetical protein
MHVARSHCCGPQQVHNAREEDWHKLANTWVEFEKELHAQYKT